MNQPDVIALDMPIACTLNGVEFAEREQMLQTELVGLVERVEELADGVRLWVSAESTPKILDFINFERNCCRFFEFDWRFSADNGPIWLDIRGPVGTKQFLTSWLPTQN